MIIRELGTVDYAPTWQAMKDFTAQRQPETPDEIWLLEHYPVYTQGLAGKAEHILQKSAIPIVQIDRGGQITYHGLGQAVMYLLLDIKRKKIGIRPLVTMMEQTVIHFLANHQIEGQARCDAPGVYVGGKKIASLGLKITSGRCYHGLALNVAMDLTPFSYINPCGLKGMEMAQLIDFGVKKSASEVNRLLAQIFTELWEKY